MQITRRGLIGGLAGLLAAPAIVRVSSLMPVKALRPESTAFVCGADGWHTVPWSHLPTIDLEFIKTVEAKNARLRSLFEF